MAGVPTVGKPRARVGTEGDKTMNGARGFVGQPKTGIRLPNLAAGIRKWRGQTRILGSGHHCS